MSWLDKKYINLLSLKLEGFKWKGNIANFRDPLCGDSQKNKHKKRGYFYEKKGSWFFHCHNCNQSLQFQSFLKTIDSNLYREYKLEIVKDNKPKETDFSSSPEKRIASIEDFKEFKKLKKISQLPETHSAKQYVVSRKIPTPYHAEFRLTPAFMEFINKLIPGKFSKENLRHDEARIIIPFYDAQKKLFALQGRSLDENAEVRYISIVLEEDTPMLWGLDRVDLSQTVYAFEGVLDAIFIPNSVAICGGNFWDLSTLGNKENFVIVYDNEPRSKEARQKITKAIIEGYKVCIWPPNIISKDINKMILNESLTTDYIRYIIDTNTFEGSKAKVALSRWSKMK